MSERRIVLAITGASAMPVAVKLANMLSRITDVSLGLVFSRGACRVAEQEGIDLADLASLAQSVWQDTDLGAGPASGGWWRRCPSAAMIICPCSMNTLGSIAAGLGASLIYRAASVALKEKARLVLVPRETPLSSIALKNMLTVSGAGAVIMPFCPGFYLRPRNIDELCEQFCCRILDQLNLDAGCPRWEPEPAQASECACGEFSYMAR